ncbi:MAG: DUF4126 domain-containing protein [Gammaproteobacteria bacterium]|nr:DUF4126 domain-containing protein [Gammaproteobacteria bacterium]
MDSIDTIALMLGAAWASGINLYAAVLVLGWLGGSGQIDLPPDLQVLGNPLVMLAAGGMYALEFFADKIPGVDTAWDLLHTFIRIPGGALMAAGAAQGLDIGPAAELAGLLVGGGVTAATHAAKTGSRAVINTSPEPVSNWTASVAEDVSVFAGLWAALNHPWVFVALLTVFLLLIAWLLPKLWRAIRRSLRAVGRWLGAAKTGPGTDPDTTRGSRHAMLQEMSPTVDTHPNKDPT